MSIAQGGYGFPILHPIVYNYITMGKYIGVSIIDEHVPDPFISHLVKEVRKFGILTQFTYMHIEY